MKNFIIQLLLFFSPIVLMAPFLDAFVSKNLKQSNSSALGEINVWRDLFNGTVNSDVVIYGSSRAWVHFDPQIIQDSLKLTAYNLGIDGYDFTLQYLRHKLLLKYNRKPKVIIHSLDVFTLQKAPSLYNKVQFLPFMLYNKDIENSIKSYQGYHYYECNIPLIRYFGESDQIRLACKLFINSDINFPLRTRGYKGQTWEWNNDLEKAKSTLKKYEVVMDTNLVKLFKNYITESRAKNINLVFVYAPEYIDGQRFVANRAKVLNQLKYILNEYNVPFYDYSTDSICYNKKYFYNSLHMNKNGAELFTRKLMNQLKKSSLDNKMAHFKIVHE